MTFLRLLAISLAVSVAGCAQNPNMEAAAREELGRRNISIDIAGLRKATSGQNDDGAYLFEDVGYFAGISDADFKEALQHAASTDNYGLYVMLTRHGKGIRYSVDELASFLDEAVRNGSARMVALLIRFGAEPGKDSLFHGSYKDDYDLIALLLENGAAFTAGENKKALNVAARLGHVHAVRAFIDSDETPAELVDQALIYAALTEKIEVIRYLVDSGADINHEDGDGCSALHYLAQDGSVDMIRYMARSGAQINKTCRGGETPLKWAYYGDNKEVIDFLVGVGGAQR